MLRVFDKVYVTDEAFIKTVHELTTKMKEDINDELLGRFDLKKKNYVVRLVIDEVDEI